MPYPTMMSVTALFLTCAILLRAAEAGYFPPYIEGTPLSASVVALRDPDFRGSPVYEIRFSVETDEEATEAGTVHRNYEEFTTLDEIVPGIQDVTFELPSAEEANPQNLDQYLQEIISVDRARKSTQMADFLSINWNGQNINWFKSLESFIYMVAFARLPHFQPEPYILETEIDALAPETPFDMYVYLRGFKSGRDGNAAYVDYFKQVTDSHPAFAGEPDDRDVWAPAAETPVSMPAHYVQTAVHFLPGGYLNGRTVRTNWCGYSKFNFLKEEIVREWLEVLHAEKTPQRILDMGTGTCVSAFTYAKMFPEAEVIGIDLSAPHIRFCRLKAEQEGITNVKFYQDNAESTHFPAEYFDIVHYSYMIHEMPTVNARLVLAEAFRLLKPGGAKTGFEVPYHEDDEMRESVIESNTWGYAWNSTGPHGPEPYSAEYQGYAITKLIEEVGFVNNKVLDYTFWDAVYESYKPEDLRQKYAFKRH